MKSNNWKGEILKYFIITLGEWNYLKVIETG